MAEDDTLNLDEGDDNADDNWASAMAEQLDTEEEVSAAAIDASPAVQTVDIPDLQSSQSSSDDDIKVDLDMILDIPVTISMEIGRTKINIRNLLQLNQGSVVELDRFAGEPLDVFVNGTLIAHGEVVVVNEKFGIRLTDVISANERIKKLK